MSLYNAILEWMYGMTTSRVLCTPYIVFNIQDAHINVLVSVVSFFLFISIYNIFLKFKVSSFVRQFVHVQNSR